MRTQVIPCIHFTINKPFTFTDSEILSECTEYDLLELNAQSVRNEYDNVLYAYENLTEEGWVVSIMGNSIDFYKSTIKTLEDLENLVLKSDYRKKYGKNFSIINQLFIFSDKMTKQELINSLADKTSSLVVFSTPTCGPCRNMKPTIDEIEKTYHVVKINAHEEPELASEFNINVVPTLIFYQKDQEYSRHLGVMKKEEIEKELKVK